MESKFGGPIKCARANNELILRSFGSTVRGSLCCTAADSVDVSYDGALDNVRKDLENGIWNSHCRHCKEDEENNVTSWREVGNNIPFDYAYMELYVDNTCDLKCIYCSPMYSSRWESEQRSLTRDQKEKYISILDTYEESNHVLNHTELILEKVTDFATKSNTIRNTITLLGGEPLMTRYFKNGIVQDVIEAFYRGTVPNKPLRVCVVSNGNTPDNIIDDTIESLHNVKKEYPNVEVMVVLSVESSGKNAEFVRDGLDYQRFLKNMSKYMINDIFVNIRMSVNAISLDGTVDLLNDVFHIASNENIQIGLDLNTVKHPEYLSTCMLPDEKKSVMDEVNAVIQDNTSLINDSILINDNIKTARDLIGQFDYERKKMYAKQGLKFFDYLLDIRGINIQDVNPQIYEYYKRLDRDNDR